MHLRGLQTFAENWDKWELVHATPPDDPRTYHDADGVLLSYTYNRLYTVSSPRPFDTHRTKSGLAIMRHYALNENEMTVGNDDNFWHHVVLTRDHESGVLQAYLDGRLVATYHEAGRVPINTAYGTIGQVESLPGQGQKLMATLDEVAVYDYVLSPRQVKQHWEVAGLREPLAPRGSPAAPAAPSPIGLPLLPESSSTAIPAMHPGR